MEPFRGGAPMADAVEVELYTYEHLIRGTLETSGQRLSDILNIRTESSLFLRQASVTRLLSMGKVPPLQLPVVRVEKPPILFAVPVAERDLTHKSLYKRATRRPYEIVVIVPGFELHGTVHLTDRLDLRRVLLERADDYIPLTNATVTYTLHPKISFKAGTVIFNKQKTVLVGEPLFAGGEIARL